MLLTDRESCQRVEGDDANAFEARDMENDVDPDYSDKLRNIEMVSESLVELCGVDLCCYFMIYAHNLL